MKETHAQYNDAQIRSMRHDDNAHTEEACHVSLNMVFALRSGGRTCIQKLEGQAMKLIEELTS